jgi:hypothetical protein
MDRQATDLPVGRAIDRSRAAEVLKRFCTKACPELDSGAENKLA